MIHALGLVILQRWQIGERRRLGFTQNSLRHFLQRAPAGPVEVGRVRDLAQQTPPFDNHPVDVAHAEQVRHQVCFDSGFLWTLATICSAPEPYFGGTPFSR